MAISIDTRKLRESANLVLYVDIAYCDRGRSVDNYLAEIHEETPKAIRDAYPSLPTSRRALLHSYGKRIEELSATLAFIDVLFDKSPQESYRNAVESRVFKGSSINAERYLLCVKVCDKGEYSDPRQPKSWLANFITCDASSMVLADGTRADGSLSKALKLAKDAAKEIS